MKRFLNAFIFMVAASLIAACSSSSSDPGQGNDDVFPDKQTFVVEAGDTLNVTFNATSSFRLSMENGTSWCKFIQHGEETLQYTGDAGSHTAMIYVSDAGQDFDKESVAKISLEMSGKSETIIEITRPGDTREVKMYRRLTNGTIEELESLDFTFTGTGVANINIGFTANFRWKVLSTEGGFSIANTNINGAADETTSDITFTYASLSSMAYAFSDGKIVISDPDEINTFTFPVAYAGMGSENVVFGKSSVLYGLEFTEAGYFVNDSSVTEQTSVTTTVAASNMDYEIYFVDPSTYSVVSSNDSWVTISETDPKGNLTISVDDNTGDPRSMYYFVLPRALASSSIDWSAKIADYAGVYGSLIKQQGISTSITFTLSWGLGGTAPSVVQFASSSLYENGSKTPQDWGAGLTVGNDAFVCEVSVADLNGGLSVNVEGLDVPLYYDMSIPRLSLSSLDSYSTSWELRSMFEFAGNNTYRINLSTFTPITQTVGCLQFYNENVYPEGSFTPTTDPVCVLFIVYNP